MRSLRQAGPPLSLAEEAVLLALGGRCARLRYVVKAAAHADGERRRSLRGVLRSLRSAGLVERVRRGRHEPTAAAGHADRQRRIGGVLWEPAGAASRDLDLAVLLLLSGTLAARQRRLTRGLMVAMNPDAISPVVAWLLRRYAASSQTELADAIIRETPLPLVAFEESPFDPGMSDATMM